MNIFQGRISPIIRHPNQMVNLLLMCRDVTGKGFCRGVATCLALWARHVPPPYKNVLRFRPRGKVSGRSPTPCLDGLILEQAKQGPK